MKISSFSITNYRSITETKKLSLKDVTVFVGKNNEGKSNLLKAIRLALLTLQGGRNSRYARSDRDNEYKFVWERDFPTKVRKTDSFQYTEFIIEFSLCESEVLTFKAKFGNKLNGTLPIRIRFHQHSDAPEIKVVKQGKGSESLNKKSDGIARYISECIEFNYIPAVRTAEDAEEEISRKVLSKLQELEGKEEFKAAINSIEKLQKPIIDDISTDVKNLLKEFLPSTKSVKISYKPDYYSRYRYRDLSVVINDGMETDLRQKGDGVKSLVVLSLLKNIHVHDGAASVIAFEEPESHLHPGAIELLKKAIYQLAPANQVIIATHNPLFVNRQDIHSNIVVNAGGATQASSLRDIRQALGVKISDNLYDAKVAILVEGDTDVMILKSLLSMLSISVSAAIGNNQLIFMRMGGASHISVHLNLLNNLICHPFVFLDDDTSGRNAVKDVLGSKLLIPSDYLLCHCGTRETSEIEDTLNETLYSGMIHDDYGVDINVGAFRNKAKVWSSRLEQLFVSAGKVWDESIENEIKYKVAKMVENNPATSLDGVNGDIIHKLCSAIEKTLSE